MFVRSQTKFRSIILFLCPNEEKRPTSVALSRLDGPRSLFERALRAQARGREHRQLGVQAALPRHRRHLIGVVRRGRGQTVLWRSHQLSDGERRQLQGHGRLLLDPLDVPREDRISGQRRLHLGHDFGQFGRALGSHDRVQYARYRLLPMGAIYPHSSSHVLLFPSKTVEILRGRINGIFR